MVFDTRVVHSNILALSRGINEDLLLNPAQLLPLLGAIVNGMLDDSTQQVGNKVKETRATTKQLRDRSLRVQIVPFHLSQAGPRTPSSRLCPLSPSLQMAKQTI